MDFLEMLIPNISQRIKTLRKEQGKTQLDLSSDGTLIGNIEKGKFKPGNKTFIPDSVLSEISSNLGESKFQIIFGDMEKSERFVADIYQSVAYNLNIPDEFRWHKMSDFDQQISHISNQLRNALFFNAQFSFEWSQAELDLLTHYQMTGTPFDLSTRQTTAFDQAVKEFFEMQKGKLISSFTQEFSQENKISLKKFNSRIIKWINNCFPQIIKQQAEANENDEILSIGHEVRRIMEKRAKILGYDILDVYINQSSEKVYTNSNELPQSRNLLIEKIHDVSSGQIIFKTFEYSKIRESLIQLADIYKQNAENLVCIQIELINKAKV